MSADDLGTWLKAAAENKITTKNTWKSTLIDHFSDVTNFKDTKGVNFQKASCTLDGCVKVYSTRVDDVSENALRLLEGFIDEESVKKKQTKKKEKQTLEKNLANLNIKPNNSKPFLDPKFSYLSSLPENTLVISKINVSSDGILRMTSNLGEGDIISINTDINLDFYKPNLISPSISTYKEVEEIVMEPVVENEVFEELPAEDFDISCDYNNNNNSLVEERPKPVFRQTEFSYFKGWAGPSHWKVRSRKVAQISSSSKQKEKFFINFSENIDDEEIFKTGNTLFEQASIQKRRETKNILPLDFRLEINDLYKYMVKDGSFDYSIPVEDQSVISMGNSIVFSEPADEFVNDLPTQSEQTVNILPYRKTQKRVDIKKLKDNIYNTVEKSQKSTLSSLFHQIPKIYSENESKDISIHYCIISLLHLANERNLHINKTKDNLEVTIDN